MIKEILNEEQFINETNQTLVLIDFHALWCGPCRMLGPVLEEVEEEGNTNASFIKVNVDDLKEIAARFNVQVIPTLVLLKDGKEVKRSVGYLTKNKVIDFINN